MERKVITNIKFVFFFHSFIAKWAEQIVEMWLQNLFGLSVISFQHEFINNSYIPILFRINHIVVQILIIFLSRWKINKGSLILLIAINENFTREDSLGVALDSAYNVIVIGPHASMFHRYPWDQSFLEQLEITILV